MKPTRPPVCTIGNPFIVYDQRIPRPTTTKNATEVRQIMRCMSSNHEPQQPVTYAYFPTQQRTSSPPAVQRMQIKEPVFVTQFQNPPQESIPIQHQRVVSMEVNNHQQESKQTLEIAQQHNLICDLQEQISELQKKLADKVHDYQTLKEKFDNEFKKFQDEILLQIKGMDLNIQLNDYTSYFMQEIDRKVLNLQNNINGQVEDIKLSIEDKMKQTEHLSKNLLSNTTIRINEDENKFQNELQQFSKIIQQKLDRTKAEQIINTQISALQSQYQIQLQQAQQLIAKINSDKSDELGQIKIGINNALAQVNQQVQQQLQTMLNIVNENQQAQQTTRQNTVQIKNQFQAIQNKFQQIQQQYLQKVSEFQNQIKCTQEQNKKLTKEIEQQQLIIQKQQQELYKISQNNKIEQILSPKQNKSNSFYTNSTGAGLNFTKNRPQSVSRKMLKKPKQHHLEISLDDFVDFNENSILDSNDSLEFTHEVKSSRIQSPIGKFKASQLMNINRLLNEDFHRAPMNSSSSNKENSSNPIHQAIKRRLLYLGKQSKTLLCTYQGEQLYDAEMGMQLLDDQGRPFTVSEGLKNELIAKQLIQLV